jgi:hypothetical protein
MAKYQEGENQISNIQFFFNFISNNLSHYKSCSVPKHVIIKRYWSFEVVCVCLAMVFTSIVISRKRFLDNIAYERMRKQLLS